MPAIANRSFLVELPVNRQTGCVVSRLSFEFSRIDVTRPLLLLRYIHPNKAELWLHHKLVVCDPYLDGISSLRGLNPFVVSPLSFDTATISQANNISTLFFKNFSRFSNMAYLCGILKVLNIEEPAQIQICHSFYRGWQKPLIELYFQRLQVVSPHKH